MPVYTFNGSNTVSVGNATKKEHFDQLFDNIMALKQGDQAFDKVGTTGLVTVTLTTSGSHIFSTTGAGYHRFAVRNSHAANGSGAIISMGNDLGVERAGLYLFSSGSAFSDGLQMDCAGTGGIIFTASNAAGNIYFAAGGASTRWLINPSGHIVGQQSANYIRHTNDTGTTGMWGGSANSQANGSLLFVHGTSSGGVGRIDCYLGAHANSAFIVYRNDAAQAFVIAGATGAATFGSSITTASNIFFSADATFRRTVDTGVTGFWGGSADSQTNGAGCYVFGASHATAPGVFRVFTGIHANSAFQVYGNAGTALFALAGADGSLASTTSAGSGAWTLNSTATNGAYIAMQRSGANIGYVGDAEAIDAALNSNDDFAVKATSRLYLEGASGVYSASIRANGGQAGDTMKIDSAGKLGHDGSSARFKDLAGPMPLDISRRVLLMTPELYIHKDDPERRLLGGHIAEDAARAWPGFATFEADGVTPRNLYDRAIAGAHTEVLKQHDLALIELQRRVGALEARA